MKSHGFTLVEVLIGLSIISGAAVSIAYTVASTNKVAEVGRNTFIATNLAHEGIELVRKLRDDTWLAAGPALDYPEWATAICGSVGSDITNPSIALTPNTPTFSRTVTVNCDAQNTDTNDNPEFVTVTSTVEWTASNGERKNVVLIEKLTNWYVASNVPPNQPPTP